MSTIHVQKIGAFSEGNFLLFMGCLSVGCLSVELEYNQFSEIFSNLSLQQLRFTTI